MPVPVINRALKLDPSTTGKDSVTGDAKQGLEADQKQNGADLIKAEGKVVPRLESMW